VLFRSGQWPTYFVPETRAAALAKFAPFMEEDGV
jgi:acyl-CoA dehydrogenase